MFVLLVLLVALHALIMEPMSFVLPVEVGIYFKGVQMNALQELLALADMLMSIIFAK